MTKKAQLEFTPIAYDTDSIIAFALKIKEVGFIPGADLRAEFGPDKTTQAIALLYRDFRIVREVRRAWKGGDEVLGYEWADRRFSKSEIAQVPPHLGFILQLVSPIKAKYAEFQPVTVHCSYTTPILGSVPVKDTHGDPTNMFERDASGRALILPYHQRAMSTAALPMIGKEQSVARHIGYKTIRLPINGNLKIVEHGIVDASGYGGGKGLRRSEQLIDPLAFDIHANVPTSALSIDEFLRMIRTAGEFVRLSPGRSAGFGEFEVLGAE